MLNWLTHAIGDVEQKENPKRLDSFEYYTNKTYIIRAVTQRDT